MGEGDNWLQINKSTQQGMHTFSAHAIYPIDLMFGYSKDTGSISEKEIFRQNIFYYLIEKFLVG